MKILKIATRNSPLALWQAEHVKQKLLELYSDLDVELVGMQTEGDRFLDAPLVAVGGKGLFIKELEQALLNGDADIAVHSMKDVTIDLPEDLALPVIMQREDSSDVLVSNNYKEIQEIPQGGVIGTSSLRRQSQIRALRPDIEIRDLRGNVGTRLRKLDEGEYDAIVLAAAGIKRLGMYDRIAQFIPHTQILPAVGQGAIGIECRFDDPEVHELIAPLNDHATHTCVNTERAFSRRLYGGCQLPIAAQASLFNNEVSLIGMVARVDGSEVIKGDQRGSIDKIDYIGSQLAETLLDCGADKILKELLN